MSALYDIEVEDAQGAFIPLSEYQHKVLLIVNTASRCGFTQQYAELQTLYERYHGEGLEVLAFPCNQFLQQEPGNMAEIQSFCSTEFGVTFPLFAKVQVKGKQQHPLYRYLTQVRKGLLGSAGVKWNFTKFLVSRQGEVVGRFGPQVAPRQLASDIEALLANA